MNKVLVIDTLTVAKDLQAAGFSESQAEALTRAVSRAQDVDLSHLATREDLAGIRTELAGIRTEVEGLRLSTKADTDALRLSTKADTDALRQSIKADIEALRQATRADIAELKSDLLKWIVGLFGVQTIAVIGAIVAMTRVLAR